MWRLECYYSFIHKETVFCLFFFNIKWVDVTLLMWASLRIWVVSWTFWARGTIRRLTFDQFISPCTVLVSSMAITSPIYSWRRPDEDGKVLQIYLLLGEAFFLQLSCNTYLKFIKLQSTLIYTSSPSISER